MELSFAMDKAPRPHPRCSRIVSALVLIALLAIHGWSTLRAFGPERCWTRWLSDEPVGSGRHPLHFYHAAAATASRCETGSAAGYDPTFAAGYARTAAIDFDAGPYELFLAGSEPSRYAARYKLALAVWWMLLPAGFWTAARLVRFDGRTAILAAGLAVLLAGSQPGRRLFEDGDLSQMLSGVLASLHLACLVRCHGRPDIAGFGGLLTTALLGWRLQPLIWGGVGLLSLGSWLGMSRRHGLRWHGAFGIAQAAALVLATPWLAEWVRYWWLTLPVPGSGPRVALRDSAFWNLPIWGGANSDHLVCAGLVICGFLGGLLRRRGRPDRPVRWLLLNSLLVIGLATISPFSETLAPFASPAVLFLGLSLAIVPAAYGLARAFSWQLYGPGRQYVGLVGGTIVVCVGAAALVGTPGFQLPPDWGLQPVRLGVPGELNSLAEALAPTTTAAARILWEEHDGAESSSILLAGILDRPVLSSAATPGDADADYPTLRDGMLAGRSLTIWTDDDLDVFARRYNVGWVVATTRATAERLDRWSPAKRVPFDGSRQIYAIQRPHSYVLKGRAREVTAERGAIALADVVPENGEIVLSFHYQEGLRARPGWVTVEREPDPYDPIPLIRLRLIAPTSRITLTWDRP